MNEYLFQHNHRHHIRNWTHVTMKRIARVCIISMCDVIHDMVCVLQYHVYAGMVKFPK